MPSREELLQSIQPGMKLTQDFFKRIYGYELTYPGFAEIAIQRLEVLGCSKARNYYSCVKAEIDHKYDKDMKEVAAWYVEEIHKKRGEKQRAEKLDNMSTEELLTLLLHSVERA